MAKSKLARRAFWPLAYVLVAGVLCMHGVEQRTSSPVMATAALDDWDIARLVAYLNGKGLGLRVVSTRAGGGGTDRRAFLTTTDKGWEELSRPPRDRSHIDRWRGTLLCERGPAMVDWADLTRQWGDCCLEVGPFLLFGDRELLDRVRAGLSDLIPSDD
jgi:hypothetical protein